MNRYPVWKYAVLVVALLVAIVYTLPNLFGESPAVQAPAQAVARSGALLGRPGAGDGVFDHHEY